MTTCAPPMTTPNGLSAETRRAFDRHARFINPAWTRVLDLLGYGRSFVRAEGTKLFDVEGRAYVDFLAGVTTALDHVRDRHHGAKVLVVSSGGPISTAVGHVLGTSPETTIELNLRIRNTAVTEFAFTPKRHMLVTYNTLPHLDAAAYENWVTYA